MSFPACSANRLPTMASTARCAAAPPPGARQRSPTVGCATPRKSQPPRAPRAFVAEMEQNRPTLAAARRGASAAGGACGRYHRGQWRCADCRHHQLHQYQQPERDAGRRFAGQEGGGSRPQGQAHIKTSLAPGSRVVTEYLTQTGLLPYLEKLGFALAGYGCTTCIGNAGDLTPELNDAITSNDLVCAAVLSGNRNFEARIHPNLKANFLASPPLVVAYAIAGTVLKDLMTEPVGQGKGGRDIYLGDIWPSSDEVHALMKFAMNGKAFRENYAKVASDPGKLWQNIHGVSGSTYTWPASTYIAEPPSCTVCY